MASVGTYAANQDQLPSPGRAGGPMRRKQFRAVATRYDKLACRYRASVQIADILIWLRAKPDRQNP